MDKEWRLNRLRF